MADQKLTASDLSFQYERDRKAYISDSDDVQTSEQTPAELSSQYNTEADRIHNAPYEQALRESPEFALTEVDSTKRLWNPEDRTDKEVFEDDLASALGPGEWTTADPEQLQNIIEKKFGDKYIYISRDITPEEKENTPTRFYGTNWLHADKEFGVYDPKTKTMVSLNKPGASWADLRAGVTSEIPYILATPFTLGSGWVVRGLTAGASMMGTNVGQQFGRIGLGGATNYDPLETGLIGAGTFIPYGVGGIASEPSWGGPITASVSKFFGNVRTNIRKTLGIKDVAPDVTEQAPMGYSDFRNKVHRANAEINKPYETLEDIPRELAERGYTGGASARQSSDVQTGLAQSQEILRGSGSSDRVEDQVARDYEDWLNARNVGAKDLLVREMLSPKDNIDAVKGHIETLESKLQEFKDMVATAESINDKRKSQSMVTYFEKELINANNLLTRLENPVDIPTPSDLHDTFLGRLEADRALEKDASSGLYDTAERAGKATEMTPDVIKLFYPDKVINELSDRPVITKVLKRFKEMIDPDNLIGTDTKPAITLVPETTPVKFKPLSEDTTRKLLEFVKDGRKVKIGDKITIDGVEYTYNFNSDSRNPYYKSRGFSYYFTHGDEVVRISDHWSKTVDNNRSKKFNAGGLTNHGYQWQIDEKSPIVQFKVSGEKYDSRFIGASAPRGKLLETGVEHWDTIPTKEVNKQRIRTIDETEKARAYLRDAIYNLKTGSGGVKLDRDAGDQLQRVLDNYDEQLAKLENLSTKEGAGQEWIAEQASLDPSVISVKKQLDEAIANSEDFETVSYFKDEYDYEFGQAKEKVIDKLNNVQEYGDSIEYARKYYSEFMDKYGEDKVLGKVIDAIRKGEVSPQRIMGALLTPRGVPKFGDEVVEAIKESWSIREMKDIIRYSLFTLPNDIDTPQLGMRLGSSLRTQWNLIKDTPAVKGLFTKAEQEEMEKFVNVYSQLDIARMEQRVNSATANRLLSNRAIRSPGMGVIHRLFNYVLDAGAKGEEIARRRLTMQKIIVEANEKLEKPITLKYPSKKLGILGAYVGKTLSDNDVLDDNQQE